MNRQGMAVMLSVFVCAMALELVALVDNASAFKLPGTGQTKCYDTAGAEISDCSNTGQDGEYSINPLSYTDNDNYTVTDNNTGLMWQKCSVGQTNNPTCSGTPSVYYWYQAIGIPIDIYNPSSQNVCGSAQTGYYNDWRLPTKKELLSIVNYSYEDGPVINRDFFPNTGSNSKYWASNSKAYLSAWAVAFSHGNVGYDYYPTQNYVRCVRGGQYPAQNYNDNGDGTVTDNGTGLFWQKCSAGLTNDMGCSGSASTYNWDQALSYCKGLDLGSKTDWRLPGIKELESLNDETNYNPSINAAFPRTYPHEYWSSTTIAIWPDEAFMVDFYMGTVINYYKSDAYYVRCVRGGQSAARLIHNGSLLDAYTKIQTAYDHAADGDIIQVQAGNLAETLSFGSAIHISLEGGYDSDYTLNSGMTTVSGVLTISGGTVTIENVALK
jgi:hypothetical protein